MRRGIRIAADENSPLIIEPSTNSTKKPCCWWGDTEATQKKTYCLRVTLGIFAALVVIAVAIVAIFAIVYSSNANALQRYCVEANGTVFGYVSMDVNDRDIEWEIQHTPDMGTVVSLHIMGPIPIGLTEGPLDFALCGSPSSLACDLTTPNFLKDRIVELNPGGTGLKPLIQAIRTEPWRYYLQINRGAGDPVRAGLGQICGTAS